MATFDFKHVCSSIASTVVTKAGSLELARVVVYKLSWTLIVSRRVNKRPRALITMKINEKAGFGVGRPPPPVMEGLFDLE